MALIERGILGGLSGSVGHVSGQISKGRSILTSKANMEHVTKSSAQVSNNDKFNVLRKLYLHSNETINKIVCANNSNKEAGYNFFSRKNYDNFTSDNIVSVNSIYVGNSEYPRVQVLTAKYNSAHTQLTVTYSTSTFGIYGSSSETYCCLYDATNILLYCIPTNYNFFSGNFVIELPSNEAIDFNNLYVSVIASSNLFSKRFSNTVNNWVLSSASLLTFNWLLNPITFDSYSFSSAFVDGVFCEGCSFVDNTTIVNSNNVSGKYNNDIIFIAPLLAPVSSNVSRTISVLVGGVSKSVVLNLSAHSFLSGNKISNHYRFRGYSRNAVSNRLLVSDFNVQASSFVIGTFYSDVNWIVPSLSSGSLRYSLASNSDSFCRLGSIFVTLKNDSNLYKFSIVQYNI